MDLDQRVSEFLSDSWDLPGIPHICQALVVATFLDADGAERWAFFPMGEANTTQMVGLLEFVKASMMDEVLYGCDDDEDDD